MSPYAVTQQIHFCYGHRLLNYEGKCVHLHGHNAVAELTFQRPALDSQGMVIDFATVKKNLGHWIDEALDHKMLLHENDPLAPLLEKQGEPVFRMKENPTAENIAWVIFEKAKAEGLPVIQVTLWETPTQSATYKEI